MRKMNGFLDRHVLPWPVRFLTHRFIILATIALLVPLIAFAYATKFVLAVNSYLNTMSVAVGSIVLLYATIAEIRDKQIAEMQERRAQEDHTHVVEMHQLVLDGMRLQHEQIQDLKQVLAEMRGIAFERAAPPRGLMADLRSLHASGRGRFDSDHVRKRMSRQVGNRLGDAVAALTLPAQDADDSGA
jgi:hypothetical protein